MRRSSISSAVESKLRDARVARLATVDSSGRPHLVPVCFVYDNSVLYTAVDHKPKRISPEKLARVRNLKASAHVTLLVDHYSENWKRLWYIQVRGKAKLIAKSAEHARAIRLLRAKYPQYSAAMLSDDALVIRINPNQVIAWGRL
jgi:PPOX class probable F420-dependent enzyme